MVAETLLILYGEDLTPCQCYVSLQLDVQGDKCGDWKLFYLSTLGFSLPGIY